MQDTRGLAMETRTRAAHPSRRARISEATYSTSAPTSQRTTAPATAISNPLPREAPATEISIGSIAADPCKARVSRPNLLDHPRSVITDNPSRAANSAALTPVLLQRDTVLDHHARDCRSRRSMPPIRPPSVSRRQLRARSDGYLPTLCSSGGRPSYLGDEPRRRGRCRFHGLQRSAARLMSRERSPRLVALGRNLAEGAEIL
jgi:hypothetical protein